MSTPTRPQRSAFESNVWKSFVYAFLMDFSLTAPIWVLYLRDERGFSLTQITLLEVPLFLLIVFAEIPTGAVADRFGRRVSLMLSSSILGLSLFVYGVASSYPVILISNVAWGLAFTFRSGADTALLYDSLKKAGREEAFPHLSGRFWALRSTAMLGALLLGAPIAAISSYTVAITVNAIIAAAAVMVALSMHEPKGTPEHAHDSYLRTLTTGLRESWGQPSLRYIFLYSGIIGAGAAGPLKLLLQPWLAAHAVRIADLGLWQAPIQAAEILSALTAPWLLARLGEPGAFLTLPLALGLCGIALAGVEQTWIAAAFFGVAAVQGLRNPMLAGYINRRIESERRATILSVESVVGNAAMLTMWPLAGLVTDAFGLRATFFMYGCAALVCGTSMLRQWQRAERKHSTIAAGS